MQETMQETAVQVPVLLVKRDANGNVAFTVGTREMGWQERFDKLNKSLAQVIVTKIRQDDNKKVDQRVLSTEIGVS